MGEIKNTSFSMWRVLTGWIIFASDKCLLLRADYIHESSIAEGAGSWIFNRRKRLNFCMLFFIFLVPIFSFLNSLIKLTLSNIGSMIFFGPVTFPFDIFLLFFFFSFDLRLFSLFVLAPNNITYKKKGYNKNYKNFILFFWEYKHTQTLFFLFWIKFW